MPNIANISSKLTLDIGEFRTNATVADRQTARYTERLEQQAAAVGLTRREAKLQQLAQKGATAEVLEAAQAAEEKLKATEAAAAADRRAAQIIDRTRSATDRYNDEVKELRELQQSGRLTSRQYAAALDRVAEEHGQGRRAVLRHLNAQQRLNRATAAIPGLAGAAARGIATGAAAIGVAGAAAAVGLAAVYERSSQRIDETAKLSDALGVQTEALTGLRFAAELTGAGSDALDKGLARLARGVGEAAQGTGTAMVAFEQLGLSVSELETLTPDQQFARVADAISGVQSATERVTLAQQIFGRQGVALVNTLSLGSEGLAAQAAEADRLGLSFSRVDAAQVEAANDAITRVQAAIGGVAQRLTIELAPFVEAAADRFVELAGSGEGMAERVTNAVEFVATGIAKIADFINLPKTAFFAVQAVVTEGLAVIVDGVQLVIDGVVALANLLPGVEVEANQFAGTFADELRRAAGEAEDAAGRAFEAWSDGAASAAVASTFESIRADAMKTAEAVAESAQSQAAAIAEVEQAAASAATAEAGRVEQTLANLERRVRLFGASESERILDQLNEAGATTEQIARATEQLRQLDALQAAADADSNRSSNASADRRNTDIQALRAGSAEARLAAFVANQNAPGTSGVSGGDDTPRRQLTEAEQTNVLLDRIDRRQLREELNPSAGGGQIFINEATIA